MTKTKKKPKVLLGGGGATSAGWHSIAYAFRCMKAYQFSTVRNIITPKTTTPDHFAVGLLFHAGRARWFANRCSTTEKSWKSIEEALATEAQAQSLPITLEATQRTLKLLTQYIEFWKQRPAPDPVAAEYLLGPTPLEEGDKPAYWRTARLDDVSRYPEAGGKLCIGESKTTSDSIDKCVQEYELHGQPMLQVALWRMDPNGAAKFGDVAGVMMDVIKKGYGSEKPKFARVFLPVTDHAMSWYVKNMRHKLRQAAGVDWDSDVPRNIAACTYMAGRARVDCEFKDLCRFGRTATTKYLLKGGHSLVDKKNWKGETPPWE